MEEWLSYAFMMRTCINCDEEIPASKKVNAKYCSNDCGSRYRLRRYYWNNYDDVAEKRKRDNADAERRMHYRVKHRAKKLGIKFDIEVSDIVVPDYCPVLGISLFINGSRGRGFQSDSPSLDRIRPELGYVKGNVRVISARANLLKSDATIQELEAVLQDLRDIWRD